MAQLTSLRTPPPSSSHSSPLLPDSAELSYFRVFTNLKCTNYTWALDDSAASRHFISPDLVTRLGLTPTPTGRDLLTTIADNRTLHQPELIVRHRVRIGNFSTSLNFTVLNDLPTNSMILGKPLQLLFPQGFNRISEEGVVKASANGRTYTLPTYETPDRTKVAMCKVTSARNILSSKSRRRRAFFAFLRTAPSEDASQQASSLPKSSAVDPSARSPEEKFELIMTQLEANLPPDLDPAIRSEFLALCREYPSIFTPNDELPIRSPEKAKEFAHKIELLTGAKPKNNVLYHMTPAEKDELKRQLELLLKFHCIRPSHSDWAAPVLFARKKDGGLRFCIDFRHLNTFTRRDATVTPLIDDVLSSLAKAQVFSTMDLHSGYHQISIHEDSIKYTAFRTCFGNFEWLVLPFGLTNAPATFVRAMNHYFFEFLNDFLEVYVDDLLTHSATYTDHLTHLRKIFATMNEHDLKMKPKKCSFFQTKLVYLGFELRPGEIRPDPSKVESIKAWPFPTTINQCESFVGAVRYLSRFIPQLYDDLAPFHALIKGKTKRKGRDNSQIECTPELKTCFKNIISKLTSNPVLVIPDSSLPKRIVCDGSGVGMGFCLMQQMNPTQETSWRPVLYKSCKKPDQVRSDGPWDSEIKTVVYALEKCRPYIYSQPVEIHTDHKALEQFFKQPTLNWKQTRMLMKMLEYAPTFKYLRGAENGLADYLSRLPALATHESSQSSATSAQVLQMSSLASNLPRAVQPCVRVPDQLGCSHSSLLQCVAPTALVSDWGATIKTHQLTDEHITKLKQILNNPSHKAYRSTSLFYYVKDDVLHYADRLGRTRIVVPASLVPTLLHEFHDTPLGGHVGRDKLANNLSKQYYFPRFHELIQKYVKSCHTCQVAKTAPKIQVPAIPLELEFSRWKHISIDHICDLPDTPEGYDRILVIVCRGTKRVHLLKCMKSDTSQTLFQRFFNFYFPLHGIPTSILSDRDTLFTASDWQSIWNKLETRLKMASTGFPQTDGQSEAAVKVVQTFMRLFVKDAHGSWPDLLPLAEFAFNSAIHSGTGISPFELDLGYVPSTPLSLSLPATDARNLTGDNFEAAQVYSLEMAHERLHVANKLLTLDTTPKKMITFKPGDQVLVLADWLLKSKRVHQRRKAKAKAIKDALGEAQKEKPKIKEKKKWLPLYAGPFQIISKINDAAYKVDLQGSKVHNTINVIFLKKYHQNDPVDFPERYEDEQVVITEDGTEYGVKQIIRAERSNERFYYITQFTGPAQEVKSLDWHLFLTKDFSACNDKFLEFIKAHPDQCSARCRNVLIRYNHLPKSTFAHLRTLKSSAPQMFQGNIREGQVSHLDHQAPRDNYRVTIELTNQQVTCRMSRGENTTD
jgi:hypothetical protein